MTEGQRVVLFVAVLGVLFLTAGVGTVAAQSAPDCSNVNYNGDGTDANPYEVSDVDELQCIENQDLDANYVQVSDIDASGTSSWNGGNGFDPIGELNRNRDTEFTGTFDGESHTISELTIDRGSTKDIGVFGVVGRAGSLKKVGVENVDITGDRRSVGGLVGQNAGTVENSYVTGTVSGGADVVAGLIGSNSDAGTVRESYATGPVSGDTSGDPLDSFVRGLVGSNAGTVENSYWDTESTGQPISEGGTGLTTSEMTGDAAANNMRGFDFTNTWETVSGEYPKLNRQSDGGKGGSSDSTDSNNDGGRDSSDNGDGGSSDDTDSNNDGEGDSSDSGDDGSSDSTGSNNGGESGSSDGGDERNGNGDDGSSDNTGSNNGGESGSSDGGDERNGNGDDGSSDNTGSNNDGERDSSDGGEGEGLPGFTVVTALLALLTVVAAAVRRRRE